MRRIVAPLLLSFALVAALFAAFAIAVPHADAAPVRVGLWDSADAPNTSKLLKPGERWYPAGCQAGYGERHYRFSDLSAYRSNGRPLGAQQWITDDLGRRDHALAWAGNLKRNSDAYVYYYARGWSDNQRPYFVNNTRGRVIAAAWCG